MMRQLVVMDEFDDILVPDEIKHVMPPVHQKSQQVVPRPYLMQLPRPKTHDPVRGMTQLDVERSDTISTKVIPYATRDIFVDP